jgi:hypothetical protein
MDSTCVASVLKCPKTDGKSPCTCVLKTWDEAEVLEPNESKGHTTLACLTGRKDIPDSGH